MLKQNLHEEFFSGDIKLSKVKQKSYYGLIVRLLGRTIYNKSCSKHRNTQPSLQLDRSFCPNLCPKKVYYDSTPFTVTKRESDLNVALGREKCNFCSYKTECSAGSHLYDYSTKERQFRTHRTIRSLKQNETETDRQMLLHPRVISEDRQLNSCYLIDFWSNMQSSKLYRGNCGLKRLKNRSYFYIQVLFLLLLFLSHASSLCSTSCICKWKGNKQTVECPNKGLTTIPVEIDPGTQVLDLTGNPLVIIPREKFQSNGLINLQKIFAGRCKLVQLDDLAFKGLNNLVELDLSNNKLRMIPVAALRQLPSLMRLQLSHNPITKIKNSSFKNLQHLISLELSGCSITSLEPLSFEGLQNLEWLKLDFNKLQTVPITAVLPNSLHGLNLHNNPWHCDCQLKKLRKWLLYHNVPSPIEPKCYGPLRLRNVDIKRVRENELACVPKIHPSSLFLDVLQGKNVTFDCHVSSVPDALIKWTFNGQSIVNSSFLYDDIGSLYVFEEQLLDDNIVSYLRIESVKVEHSGIFQCSAENQAGKKRSNFTLRVALPPTEASVEVSEVDYVVYIGASLVALVILVIVLSCILIVRCCRKHPNPKHKLIVSNNILKKPIDITNEARSSSMSKYNKIDSSIPRINGIQHNSISVIDTSPFRGAQLVRISQTNPDLLANGPEEKKHVKKKVIIAGVEEMDASGVITTRKLDDIIEESEVSYNLECNSQNLFSSDKKREEFTNSWIHDRSPYPLTSVPPSIEKYSRRDYNSDDGGHPVSYGILKHKPWKDTNDIETSNSQKIVRYDIYKHSPIPSYATMRRKRPVIAESHEKTNGQVHAERCVEICQFPHEQGFRQTAIKSNVNFGITTNGYCKTKQECFCESCSSHTPEHFEHSVHHRIPRDVCGFDNLLASCGSHCCYNGADGSIFNNALPGNYRPILVNPTPPPPAGYGDSEEEDGTEKLANQWETEDALSPSTRILYSPELNPTAPLDAHTDVQDDSPIIIAGR